MIRCARGKFTINSFHRALEIVKMLSVSQATVNRRLVDCGILLSFIKFCPMSYSEVDEIIRNIKGHFPGSVFRKLIFAVLKLKDASWHFW